MAAPKERPPIYKFELQVQLETLDKTDISTEGILAICKYLSTDISLLNKHLHKDEKLHCICVSSIVVRDGFLVFEFVVENFEELNEFYRLSSNDELSRAFTKYADDNCLQKTASLKSSTKLKVLIKMDQKTYQEAVSFFKGKDSYNRSLTTRSAFMEDNKKIRGDAEGASNANTSYINKEVILALPEFITTDSLKNVLLKVEDISIPNSTVVHEMEKGSCCVMLANVPIPSKSQTDSIRYEFTINTEVWGIIKNKPKSYKSQTYKMTDQNVIRQYLNYKSVTAVELSNHLKHIIIVCSAELSLRDCAMQIEDLCKYFRIIPKDFATNVFNLLYAEADKTSNNHLVLCIVLFGNLFRNYEHIVNAVLKQELCQLLLSCLKHFKCIDLPCSCSSYLFTLTKYLCKVGLGKNYCFLTFLDTVYPFFEETHISEKLIEVISSKERMVPEEVNSEIDNRCLNLFANICERLNNKNANKLLEQLIRHLPLRLAIMVYKSLKKKWSTFGAEQANNWELVHESVMGSLKSHLISAKKGAEKLNEIAKQIEECQDLSAAILSDFEKAIMQCLVNENIKELEFFKRLVFQYTIFISEQQQIGLITSLAECKHPDFHYLLFEVLSNTKFREVPVKVVNDILFVCFDNAISQFRLGKTVEQRLKDIYRYLSKVYRIPNLKPTEKLTVHLNDITVDYLKRIDLKGVMQHMPAIEELCKEDPHIAVLFETHIKMLLNKRYTNYHEMLLNLCGTYGKLRINSSVAAAVVNSVVTLCMPKRTTVLERFKEVINQCAFWGTIMIAEGKEVSSVMHSENYKSVINCLAQTVNLLQAGEICYCYLDDASSKIATEEVLKLFELSGTAVKVDVKRYWNSVECCFESELKKISCTYSTLTAIQEKIQVESNPSYIKVTLRKLNLLKKNILEGKISAGALKRGCMEVDEVKKMHSRCIYLQEYVTSDIFWNACSAVVKTEFDNKRAKLASEEHEKEAFESIHRLFGESLTQTFKDETVLSVMDVLLEVLTDIGINEYKQVWMSLLKTEDRNISYVLALLNNVDIEKEICQAENALRQPIPDTLIKTLHHLKDLRRYDNMAVAIKKCLHVFSISLDTSRDLQEAIFTFENLMQRSNTCTYAAVVKSLERLDVFSNALQPETVEILRTFSDSSSLVGFLRKIVDEDIRNLIDAVEDISEQHVQASTVSALIEVKSFLHGLLVKSPKDLSAQEFLDNLNKQTKALSTNAANLPAKINECMNSLHSLISLYGNVANRGEMTAEIIKNTITKGKFEFTLDENGICNFYVTYKRGPVREKQTKLSLIDLRSRALLLMNTQTKSNYRKNCGQDLEQFVSYVDLCIDIGELVEELHYSGNINFIAYSVKQDHSGLVYVQKQLRQELIEWTRTLMLLREEFYLLNFIRGPDIHLLYSCFEKNLEDDKVKALLRYIHPELRLDLLINIYNSLKENEKGVSNETLLRCFGRMLHLGYDGKTPIERKFPFIPKSVKLTETVQNKQICVVTLEENSNLVIKTLLSLYINTTQTFPEPHQVLFCTRDTTWNDLELLIYRCLGSSKFSAVRQLFCIANIEMLSNELQFKLVEKLKHTETNENYLLSVIFKGSGRHPLLDELSSSEYQASSVLSDEQLRQALQVECPNVVTYTSTVPGLGKSSRIKENALSSAKTVVTLNISGPLHRRTIIDRLSSLCLQECHALHIEIGSVSNVIDLDSFIFELIVLRYATTGLGSYSMQTEHILIEVANTINDSLRNALNTVMAFKREHLKWGDFKDFHISMEINSPIQVVCQYLKHLENGLIDRKDLQFSKYRSEQAILPNQCRRLLRKYFGQDSDLSFTVVNIFLFVLADQLKKMACSSFFRISRLLEMTNQKTAPDVRSKLLMALIKASKEFSTRSVKSCRSIQISTIGDSSSSDSKAMASSTDSVRRVDLTSQRLNEMVRWGDSNHMIFVFHSQNIQTVSAMYRDLKSVPKHVKSLFESQIKRDLQDFNSLSQDELFVLLQKVARTNPLPLCQSITQILNTEYALTPDNLLKMVLIMLRVNAHIPVVIMGETGCGKTSLIRYLAKVSDVNLEVISIHAGVGETHILETISQCNEKAASDADTERWLFFDEINTSEHIGILTDAICSRKYLGKTLVPNLTVMGACNPYKLRTESAVSTAGLKGKIQTDELSKLVYRVLPLPERLVDYVWDFGTLSDQDERVYIRRMIDDVFQGDNNILKLLQDLLSASQMYVRNHEHVPYCVSLRDIQRCKSLIKWFLKILPGKTISCTYDTNIKAIILALSICYHSRFSSNEDRLSYREELQKVFSKNNICDVRHNNIQEIILEEQKDILRRMDLPTGTAKNTALQENVFVILVCLLNKIPIFLVGKPGCSKSLSMQVIRSNLRGKDSKDPFFRSLPQLYCVSFQGSESSTSDGIIKVFDKAIRYQKFNSVEEVLSVVILDEIGLAEVSKFNPLKVLHSLLEPDGRQQPDVAVVGISNWALDASKMNRGIHLSRPDMDEEELYQTAISISESFTESSQQVKQNGFETSVKLRTSIKENACGILQDIARCYYEYVEKLTFKHFHGLRDYYALVKFISRSLLNKNGPLDDDEKDKIVLRGLQRNFGGLPAENDTLLDIFQIKANNEETEARNVLKLMGENINDPLARHLMCITSGDSTLSLVESVLTDIHRDEKVVIFGSHFEEDQTADYNYRILSRIILCMEQGFVLILKDLENVYGSLYDMLNQNYTVIGKKKHCRVALGQYSNPLCHVHDKFRCIVLVDESSVDYSDPPFLNRFEKQYLRFTDTVTNLQAKLMAELSYWTKQFANTKGCVFDESDCFPVFSQDMIPSLIIKICRVTGENNSAEHILEMCKRELLHSVQPDAIFRLERNASVDMCRDAMRIKDEYLKLPLHEGIWRFIDEKTKHIQNKDVGLLMIVLTNSSIHSHDFYRLKRPDVQIENLGAFKSEKQLQVRLQAFWTEAPESMLFLHCDAIEDVKHISLAKATIENIRRDTIREKGHTKKHVYLIIHLDRRRTEKSILPINYLSGWEIVTLDSINEPEIPLTELCAMSLYEAVNSKRPWRTYIVEQLFWSFSRIRYQELGRELNSIQKIIEHIQGSHDFLNILEEHICGWIKTEVKGRRDIEWVEDTALSSYLMTTYASFIVCLEQELLKIIREPLSKLIFQMENMNVISCYFCESESHISQRKEIIAKMLGDKDFFSISGIQDELGPECYLCTAADLPLRMPFSKLVFDKVEETKDEFMDYYFQVKEKFDLDKDEDMPQDILADLFSKHERVIEQTLANMSEYLYDSLCDDYFHDFCHIASITAPLKGKPVRRYQIIRWCLERETNQILHARGHIELIVKVHALYWIFSPCVSAQYQLFEICSEVFTEDGKYQLLSDAQNERPFNIQENLDPTEGFHKLGYSQTEDMFISGPKDTGNKLADTRITLDTTFSCRDTPTPYVNEITDRSVSNISTNSRPQNMPTQIGSETCSSSIESAEEAVDHSSSSLFRTTSTMAIVDEGKSVTVGATYDFTTANILAGTRRNEESFDTFQIHNTNEMTHFDQKSVASDTTYEGILTKSRDDQSVNNEIYLLQPPAEMNLNGTLDSVNHVYEANEGNTECVHQSGQIITENKRENIKVESVENVGLICSKHETDGTIISANVMKDKVQSAPDQNDAIESDSRIKLVQFVCSKLLPSKESFDLFESVEAWQRRVSSVLINAINVSSEPPDVLQYLRFCYDLISALAPPAQKVKWEAILNLGKMLKSSEKSTLESSNCFETVCDLLFKDPKVSSRDAKVVISSYLNRCLAVNVDSQALSFFLKLTKDQCLTDDDFDVFAPPIELALKFDIDGNDINVIYCLFSVSEIDPTEFPFLHALDETLKDMKASVKMDSQFPILLIDILEDIFKSSLQNFLKSDSNCVKEILMHVSNRMLENEYGLQFLAAISHYKAFTKYFINLLRQSDFDTSKGIMFLQVMKAIVDKDSENTISVLMKQYFIRQLGKGMLPWTLYKTCDSLAGTFNFLKSFCWREKYLFQCLEGNPMMLYAPKLIQQLEDIFLQKNIETQSDILREILNSTSDETSTIAVFGIGLAKFYIARSYKQQDDTLNQMAKFIVHIAEESSMDSFHLHFLACLLGVRTFPELDLNENSSENHTSTSIFSCSLFSLILASTNTSVESSQLSFLAKLLLRPSEVSAVVMTSLNSLCHKEPKRMRKMVSRESIYTCACGYRVFHNSNATRQLEVCHICAQEIKNYQKQAGPLSSEIGEEEAYVQTYSCYTSPEAKVAKLFCHLCVHACLLGSLSFSFSNTEDIENIIEISGTDNIRDKLIDIIHKDFCAIQGLMNMNCRDLYVFLQACLWSLKILLCDDKSLITSQQNIIQWTEKIESHIRHLVKDRYGCILDIVEKHSDSLQIICEGPELSVNENDYGHLCSDMRKLFVPSLFRIQGETDFVTFELDLHLLADSKRHPFPFLLFVLEVLPHLALTEHLVSIVRWHTATVALIKYRIKRRQCLQMTVEEFIYYDENETIRTRLKNRFEKLQESLTVLMDSDFCVGVLDNRITSQTKMKDCLILCSDSVLQKIITKLVAIHNTFLDITLQISVDNDCKALHFLSKGKEISAVPCINLCEVRPSSLVAYHWKDELLKFSHADLRYGHGGQMKYEYEAIEKTLAIKLVAGKTYILLDNGLPSVLFVDEFYKGYGKMATEICKIIPQKPLTSDIIQGIEEKREKHPRLTFELITHIGVLISLAKKTKGEPTTSVKEFVETWKNILTSPLPAEILPAPENSLKLCHLIALYGLLEELNADSFVDSLDEEYRAPLSLDIQNQLSSLLRSNKKFAKIFLKATKRFSHRCLLSGEIDSTQALSVYLADESFWPCDVKAVLEMEDKDNQMSHIQYIPEDLKVHHVQQTIVFIEKKLKDLLETDVALSQVVTSFASLGGRTKAEKKRKLALKRIV